METLIWESKLEDCIWVQLPVAKLMQCAMLQDVMSMRSETFYTLIEDAMLQHVRRFLNIRETLKK